MLAEDSRKETLRTLANTERFVKAMHGRNFGANTLQRG
jgi:hypothetical protein